MTCCLSITKPMLRPTIFSELTTPALMLTIRNALWHHRFACVLAWNHHCQGKQWVLVMPAGLLGLLSKNSLLWKKLCGLLLISFLSPHIAFKISIQIQFPGLIEWRESPSYTQLTPNPATLIANLPLWLRIPCQYVTMTIFLLNFCCEFWEMTVFDNLISMIY